MKLIRKFDYFCEIQHRKITGIMTILGHIKFLELNTISRTIVIKCIHTNIRRFSTTSYSIKLPF